MRIKPFRFPEMPPTECQVCGGNRLDPSHACTLVASYEDAGNNWRGVIRERESRRIVAVVLGTYRNRDQGHSASGAARALLATMQRGGPIEGGSL